MSIFANLGKKQPVNMQEAMNQLKANPAELIKQAGYNVPANMANDPRSAVMHIIQSGQVANPLMQRIQPMLNQLMGRR